MFQRRPDERPTDPAHLLVVRPEPVVAYEAQIAADAVRMTMSEEAGIWLSEQLLALLADRDAYAVAVLVHFLADQGRFDNPEDIVNYVRDRVSIITQPLA